MPQTVEAVYQNGIVELKQKPTGITRAKALVIFLDAEEVVERHAVDLEKVRRRNSSVDKWVGIIKGVQLGDWKAERRAAMEGKSHESAH
jgi:predicted DNA-binding antitoxin AbrB/MazE fold protein